MQMWYKKITLNLDLVSITIYYYIHDVWKYFEEIIGGIVMAHAIYILVYFNQFIDIAIF